MLLEFVCVQCCSAYSVNVVHPMSLLLLLLLPHFHCCYNAVVVDGINVVVAVVVIALAALHQVGATNKSQRKYSKVLDLL